MQGSAADRYGFGLPMSRSQIKKLGRRLRSAQDVSDDDLQLLETLLAAYDDCLTYVTEKLTAELGLAPGSRLKNTGTIVEKLRRSPTGQLENIQDLAGCRIILDRDDRATQDRIRDRICELFAPDVDGVAPKIIDRRVQPIAGYRAVHIVIRIMGIPVEIQLRTSMQHRWAEYYEKLSDLFGREIRYEEPPTFERLLGGIDDPAFRDRLRVVIAGGVQRLVDTAMRISVLIDEMESIGDEPNTPDSGARDRVLEYEQRINGLIEGSTGVADDLFASLREMLS